MSDNRLRVEVELNDDEVDGRDQLTLVLGQLRNTQVVAGPNPPDGIHHQWPTYTVEGPRDELVLVIARQHALTTVDGAPALSWDLLDDLSGEFEEALRHWLGYGVTA